MLIPLGPNCPKGMGEWETSWVHCSETQARVSLLRFPTPLEAGWGGAVTAKAQVKKLRLRKRVGCPHPWRPCSGPPSLHE